MNTLQIVPKQVEEFVGEYHTFALEAGKTNKKFQIEIGGDRYRVLHGQEIVYEGTNLHFAVAKFNELSGFPNNPPKIDN